ncbi:MAG: mechanosensitive ion channel [Pseudohongiellaceae bacterium]|nr:mechanosensitive ion channel [Pseudohongiellaceae bacterium]
MKMSEAIINWFNYWLAQASTAQFWWQLIVFFVAGLGASALNARVQILLETHNTQSSGLRHLAIRSAQRLQWPLSALLLLVSGRAVLQWYEVPVILLDIAVPILVALAVVRLSVYVLRKAFTVNPLLKSSEHVLAFMVWGLVILHLLGWLPGILTVLDGFAVEIGESRFSVLSVIKLLMIVAIAFTLAIWLSEVISRQLRKSAGISLSMQVGINKFSRFLLITLAFLMALNAVGIDLSSLAIFGGALGVGLGFGLQRIASNFISGFILVFDRSIKPGDVITVGSKFGWVQELNSRYVVVRNRDGVDTLIPNENLITSEVINWSYLDRNVRLTLSVQISYDDDPEAAMAIMLGCAHASPRVINEPEPVVRLMQFADSGIELQMRVWIADPENGFANVTSDINVAIWRAFKESGITIPYPQRDLHIKSMPDKGISIGD